MHWDTNGNKGIAGKIEVSLIPKDETWTPIIWVGRTHIATLKPFPNQTKAQVAAERYAERFAKETQRMLDRIGYNTFPTLEEDEG